MSAQSATPAGEAIPIPSLAPFVPLPEVEVPKEVLQRKFTSENFVKSS